MNTDHHTDCGYALLQLTRDNITSAMEETRFLGIALCTRGTARVTMNVNSYDLAPNSILIIPPNSMMQVTEASPDWEAKLICVTRMELLRDAAAQILPYVKGEDSVQQFLFQERDSIVSSFHSIYNFLDMLLSDEHTVSKYEQGVCVFRCLMLGMRDKSARHRTQGERGEVGTTSLSAFKHFMQLLSQHSKTTHSVKDYADMLHISPQYLGRICRMYDGRGPKEMVDDILLLQLKSSLKNTEKTMKELCYEYNFPTLSFMCSFFRRHTGHTPTEFRCMYREGVLQ